MPELQNTVDRDYWSIQGDIRLTVRVQSYIVEETATTATVLAWTGYKVSAPAYYNGGTWTAAGLANGTAGGVYSDGSDWVCVYAGRYTLTKRYGEPIIGYQSLRFSGNQGFAAIDEVLAACTIPARAYGTPPTPTNPKATRNAGGTVSVAWSLAAQYDPTRPNYVSRTYIQRQTDGGAWQDLANVAADQWSYTDSTASAGHYYSYRLRAYNGATYGNWATTNMVCRAPAAPKGFLATRYEDSRVGLVWQNACPAYEAPEHYEVQRQTDGGSWQALRTLPAGNAGFADTTTTANHYYRWRIRAVNGTGASAWASSMYVYMTPAAPTGVKASMTASATVTVTWTDHAVTDTSCQVQRSTDGSTWTALATIAEQNVTSYVDSFSGTAWYRVRYLRDGLASAWAKSGKVTAVAIPTAPTQVAPPEGKSYVTGTAVALQWRHNCSDNSAQTAAQVQVSTDGGSTSTTHSVSGATATLEVTAPATSGVLKTWWRVRTKGLGSTWGAWSAWRSFQSCANPSVSIVDPAANGHVYTAAPVTIVADVAAIDAYTVRWRAFDRRNRTVYDATTTHAGASRVTHTIPVSKWAPTDGETYTIEVQQRTEASLTASQRRTVTAAYNCPAAPGLVAEPDEATGSVSVTVSFAEPEVSGSGTSALIESQTGRPFARISVDGSWSQAAQTSLPVFQDGATLAMSNAGGSGSTSVVLLAPGNLLRAVGDGDVYSDTLQVDGRSRRILREVGGYMVTGAETIVPTYAVSEEYVPPPFPDPDEPVPPTTDPYIEADVFYDTAGFVVAGFGAAPLASLRPMTSDGEVLSYTAGTAYSDDARTIPYVIPTPDRIKVGVPWDGESDLEATVRAWLQAASPQLWYPVAAWTETLPQLSATVTVPYQETSATVGGAVFAYAVTTVQTDYIALARVVDGTEEQIATGLADGDSVLDHLPPLNTDVVYRATAWTDYGSSAHTDATARVGTGAVFLNWGGGFSELARLEFDPAYTETWSDNSQVFEAAGHSKPILCTGEGLSAEHSFTGTVHGMAEIRAFEAWLASRNSRAWYRDPFGVSTPVHAALEASAESGSWRKTYTLTVTEVE